MKYIIDNDLHIHSQLSLCSDDPEQTPVRILKYAVDNGLKDICLTDHYWDANVPLCTDFDFYVRQDYERVARALPLPQAESVKFHFGVETDMDKFMTVGVSKEEMDKFEFIIIPTTHLHMDGFTLDEADKSLESRARLWVERMDALLAMDLPFHKIGIAHMTCSLLAPGDWENHLAVLDMIPDEEYTRIFTRAAQVGVGIELNLPIFQYSEKDLPRVMRPHWIAKECGCKFYFGSDAHHPSGLDGARAVFERVIELMNLTEDDKFRPFA